jgi:AraC-like DNA-binding protein
MLPEGIESVKEIAHECGFQDVGYFRRLFRRHEGVTPSAYRRRFARLYTVTP